MTVAVEASLDEPGMYVNHLEVGHGQHEFSVYGARVPTKLPDDVVKLAMETGKLVIEPAFSFQVAPSLIPGFITALQNQYAAWVEEFGPNAQRGVS
jgi:hypothetical protein